MTGIETERGPDKRGLAEPPESDDHWRDLLEGNHPGYRYGRRVFRAFPSDIRCQLCAAPFHGPAAPLFRAVGKAQWPKNPKFCKSCFSAIAKHRGGAEVECSLLFADVRGSTTLAESMSPREFHELMDSFFEIAGRALHDHDGMVDKFVGDEIVGIFVPAMAGAKHARQAVDAGLAMISRLAAAPDVALPVGAGVHTGIAYVGAVGDEVQVDITAMGDPVNVAARLASAAGAGELLVTVQAAGAAGRDTAGWPRRELELKGKTGTTSVFVAEGATPEVGGPASFPQ